MKVNRQGVYDVHVNGAISAVTAGDYLVQLYVNGVAQPETATRLTLMSENYKAFSFEDLVTVVRGNSCCCYDSPTLVQLGVSSFDDVTGDVTFANVSLLATRLC